MLSTIKDETGRTIWDISPPLSPGLPCWPGDTPFTHDSVWSIDETCPVNVGRITLSPHFGAHADAPLHYSSGGLPIGRVPVSTYLGMCQVIHIAAGAGQVTIDDIRRTRTKLAARVLFRTYIQSPIGTWDPHFTSVAPSAIDYLASEGVILVGIDTPSLDPQESKTMEAHARVQEHGMAILEGLLLDSVPEGYFELIALPLRFAELDASPVRAILRSMEN